MRDNVNNEYGTAPDHGLFNGPVLGPLSKQDLSEIKIEIPNGTLVPSTLLQTIPGLINDTLGHTSLEPSTLTSRQSAGYWLASLGGKGEMPLAESGFKFFRNVKD